jgi:hypothetical protein
MCLLLLASMLLAPGVDRPIVELLVAGSWVERAWGAYRAGDEGARWTPQLVDELERMRAFRDARGGSPEWAYLWVLFDALIRSGAVVPAEALRPFFPDWGNEAAILMARARDAGPVLLQLRKNVRGGGQWLAVHNLLARDAPGELFRVLVGEARIRHEIRVVDQLDFGTAADWGPSRVERKAYPMEGFPEVAYYALTSKAGKGGGLVVDGPQPVYYRRELQPSSEGLIYIEGQEAVWRLLAHVSRTGPESVKDLFVRTTKLRWAGPETYKSMAEEALNVQRDGVVGFLSEARRNGMPDLGGMAFTIEPVVQDGREDRSTPLPVVEAVTFAAP